MRRNLLLFALALTACHKADNAPGPGGVTAGEDRALDQAAEMVEGQRIAPDAIPQPSEAAPAKPAPAPTAQPAPKPAAKKP